MPVLWVNPFLAIQGKVKTTELYLFFSMFMSTEQSQAILLVFIRNSWCVFMRGIAIKDAMVKSNM